MYQNKMSFFATTPYLTHLQSRNFYKFHIVFCTSTDLPGNHAFLCSQCDTWNLALLNLGVLVLTVSSMYQKVLNSSIMLKDICSPSQLTFLCKSCTSSFKYIIQDTNNNVDHMWAKHRQLQNYSFDMPSKSDVTPFLIINLMSIPIPLPAATYLLYGHLILTLPSFIYKITLPKASLKLGPIMVFFSPNLLDWLFKREWKIGESLFISLAVEFRHLAERAIYTSYVYALTFCNLLILPG